MWFRILLSAVLCGSIGFIAVATSDYKSFIGNVVGMTMLFAKIGLVFVGPFWQVIHLIRKGNKDSKSFTPGGQDSP